MAKQDFKIEDYILVTEENRRFCIREGRKVHSYSLSNKKWEYNGSFLIRPRLTKSGWFYFGTHKCFITKPESYEEYRDGFKPVIDLLIKEKKLYISQKEHLVKFEKPKE